MAPPETKDPPVMAVTEGPESSTGKGLNGKDSTRTVSDYSRRRYRLGTHVKSILRVQAMKTAPGRFPGDVYRTVDCTWVRIAELSMVRPMDRASYHYQGLVTCGNVWVCPICSANIQERRRQEVEQAIAWAEVQERAGYVVSHTFPHRVDQPLRDAARRVEAALQAPFTHVGMNYYRDGDDSVAMHNDKLYSIVPGWPIALLSLGAARRMDIRAKPGEGGAGRRPALRILLEPGSLLVMSHASQLHWEHGIPKTREPVGPRISLAFRVRPEGGRW